MQDNYNQNREGVTAKYVCMYASNVLLFRSTLPDPRETGQVLTNPTIEVGKEVPKNLQCGLMLVKKKSPQHMYKWRTGLCNAAPRLKIHANFPTPRHQNHKDPPEVHDHDRNNHWKGYQSIQWRPWNQAVFRLTKNRNVRRKNHRISQGDGRKTPSNYNWPRRIATARKSETAWRSWPNQSAVGIPLI